MKLIISLVIFLCLYNDVRSSCVTRGICQRNANGLDKTCPYYGDALPYSQGLSAQEKEEVLDVLKLRCPFLVYDENGNQKPDEEILTCCDAEQIKGFGESLKLADSVLGRCPTCSNNFARQICEMNCAPDQARFVNVYTEVSAEGIEYVNEIDYRMYEDFMNDAHASCSGVIVPQTGLQAIKLMCGNAPECTPEAWFGYSGDVANNPFTPTQVNFLKWPTPEDSMNSRAPPCNETAEGDLPCSCIDCTVTCPAGSEPLPDNPCTVLTLNCIGFSVGIIFFTLASIIVAFFVFREYKTQKNIDQKPSLSMDDNENLLTKWFQVMFAYIGGFSADNPVLILMLTSWLIIPLIYGALSINLTSKPLELWSAPESSSRIQLNYFNERFGPFYRATQVYLQFVGFESFEVNNVTYGPAFNIEAVRELIRLEDAILNIGRENGGVTLEDVCFAPLRARGGEKRIEQCTTMSVSTYFGNDRIVDENTYLTKIRNCLNNYLDLECMASWGGGAEAEIAFGGYEDNILEADTLLLSVPLSNYLLEEDLKPVLEWEENFINLLHDYEMNWKPEFVSVAYAAERSIEDEIDRVSRAEILPIVISYVLMFIYVTIALGNVRSFKTWFVDSKVSVAVCSIIVVLLSIGCAIGVMSFAGVTLTLLSINVVPFFVLSVGVDNVFLMVNTLHEINSNIKSYDDYNDDFSFQKKRKFVFEKMLGRVGPSMFVSSVTQITCFAIGTLANFPAVITFAMSVSIALGFLFLFQVTTIVAILSIDYQRASQDRLDVLCCIRNKPLVSGTPYVSVITKLMKPYTRYILRKWTKLIIFLVFIAMFSISIMLIPQIDIGLDQELSLPKDSYVYKWLQSVANLLKLGPPVYFVLKSGLNFSNPDHQNVICGGQLCNEDSLATQIFLASRYSDVTYMSRSSNSWLDDFFDWSSLQNTCCKYNTTDDSFCPSTNTSPDCSFCSVPKGEWQNGLRPSVEAFDRYIPFFLQDAPTESCSKGGLASYSRSVNYILDAEGRATVYDSNFMAYHNALSTSKDYLTALKYGYEISENITTAIKRRTGLDVEVFPYSIFYVYYEQYLTMWEDTFSSIAYCLIGAFVLNLLASGFNILTTFAVIFTSLMVVINMMGVMYIWGIPLNPVSCINLIVTIGVAVEFCSHIAYYFATSKSQGDEKIVDSMKQVGATIITGITFTNLPTVVLAFSYTEIIEIFFFRMFISLVVLGFLHGMVFFPVLLSYLNSLTRK